MAETIHPVDETTVVTNEGKNGRRVVALGRKEGEVFQFVTNMPSLTEARKSVSVLTQVSNISFFRDNYTLLPGLNGKELILDQPLSSGDLVTGCGIDEQASLERPDQPALYDHSAVGIWYKISY